MKKTDGRERGERVRVVVRKRGHACGCEKKGFREAEKHFVREQTRSEDRGGRVCACVCMCVCVCVCVRGCAFGCGQAVESAELRAGL